MKLSASFTLSRFVFLSIPCCALFLAASHGLFARGSRAELGERDERVLKPGEIRPGTVEFSGAHEVEYKLDVPASSVLVRVKLNCRQADLELSARASGTDDDDAPDFRMTTEAGEGVLSVSRFTEPPLVASRYRLRVAWHAQAPPRSVDRQIERIPFTIEAELFETRVDGTLQSGIMTSAAVDPKSGSFRTFKIEVPAGSRAVRFDIVDALSDLDLFAQRGEPVRRLSGSVHFAQHNYGRETLVIDAASSPPFQPGTWFVDVVDMLDEEHPTPFRLLATFDSKAPVQLLEIPVLAKSARSAAASGAEGSPGRGQGTNAELLARALLGVVEISTDDGAASGTLLTSDGWILTNAHVVTALGGEVLKDVVISVSLDPHRPCVEMFRGLVRQVDKQRDLALVQVTSGFYGQPLPDGYVFPTVEMGDPEVLAIGDPLWLVGYPSTGGQGSRVTITATRGIVAGFDTVAFGTVLKTDATITLGNSGGAALDAQGRIVGVPTSTIELGSGHIGYVHPLSALPAEWRATINASLARTK